MKNLLLIIFTSLCYGVNSQNVYNFLKGVSNDSVELSIKLFNEVYTVEKPKYTPLLEFEYDVDAEDFDFSIAIPDTVFKLQENNGYFYVTYIPISDSLMDLVINNYNVTTFEECFNILLIYHYVVISKEGSRFSPYDIKSASPYIEEYVTFIKANRKNLENTIPDYELDSLVVWAKHNYEVTDKAIKLSKKIKRLEYTLRDKELRTLRVIDKIEVLEKRRRLYHQLDVYKLSHDMAKNKKTIDKMIILREKQWTKYHKRMSKINDHRFKRRMKYQNKINKLNSKMG